MHSFRALPLLLLAACAASSATNPAFPDFWVEFTTAVAADDTAAVGRLTRFPFMYEGEEHDRGSFDRIYASLFDDGARRCLAAAEPAAEGDGYAAFCGAIIYIFSRDDTGWRFAEFGADPEAIDEALEIGNTASEFGSWTVVGGRTAPWAPVHEGQLANAGLARTGITIGAARVQADAPLGCTDGAVTFVLTPHEGLFQGNLPEPATVSAHGLGIEHARTLTILVQCSTGVFDYHHIAGDTLLLALDNVVWKLAPAPAATPAGAVRALLARHVAGDMHFTPETVASIRHALSATLASAVVEYFARLRTDEPPPVNGDPFTDSQEYPDRFIVEGTGVRDARAIVRVVFSSGARSNPVEFLLVQDGAHWLLDDMRYDDGNTFRALLNQ
jgi:hypothetical protein